MRKLVITVVMLGSLFACDLPAGDTVQLSSAEAAKARSIVEARQQLVFKQQELQVKFQAEMDRINEQLNTLSLQSSQLCYEFKKSHHLNPTLNYTIDEWGGQLIKQK